MCLILISWQQDPQRPLIVAANRDEYFARPSLSADFWTDHPEILAGRDVEFGGTWLGIHRNGRFAAVTNLREVTTDGELSRGNLVRDFLLSPLSSTAFLETLEAEKARYRPFNLMVCDGQTLAYSNNIADDWQILPGGQYVLGNIPLLQDNLKIQRGLADLAAIDSSHCSEEELLAMLQDDTITDPGGDELQRMLSSRFVRGEFYGTRSSTVLLQHADGTQDFWEQNYSTEQAPLQRALPARHFRLSH